MQASKALSSKPFMYSMQSMFSNSINAQLPIPPRPQQLVRHTASAVTVIINLGQLTVSHHIRQDLQGPLPAASYDIHALINREWLTTSIVAGFPEVRTVPGAAHAQLVSVSSS